MNVILLGLIFDLIILLKNRKVLFMWLCCVNFVIIVVYDMILCFFMRLKILRVFFIFLYFVYMFSMVVFM